MGGSVPLISLHDVLYINHVLYVTDTPQIEESRFCCGRNIATDMFTFKLDTSLLDGQTPELALRHWCGRLVEGNKLVDNHCVPVWYRLPVV